MSDTEKVGQSLADEYPEFVEIDEDTGERCFNIAALMQSKEYIK